MLLTEANCNFADNELHFYNLFQLYVRVPSIK